LLYHVLLLAYYLVFQTFFSSHSAFALSSSLPTFAHSLTLNTTHTTSHTLPITYTLHTLHTTHTTHTTSYTPHTTYTLHTQAVAYNNEEFVRRKFRVMNLLAEMFDDSDWHILHSPFIYTAGVTKSIVVCDVSILVLCVGLMLFVWCCCQLCFCFVL